MNGDHPRTLATELRDRGHVRAPREPDLTQSTARMSLLADASLRLSGIEAQTLVQALESAGISVLVDARYMNKLQRAAFSERETAILLLITEGLQNDQIAARLYLSVNTVKSYIRTAYRKMGVGTRSQAVRWLTEAGF